MDSTQITIITGAVTTLAAILGPVISSVVTARTNKQIKRMEVFLPMLATAIENFTKCYSALIHISTTNTSVLNSRTPASRYYDLVQAGHKLLALLPSKSLRKEISTLLLSVESNGYLTNDGTDAAFSKAIDTISVLAAKKL